MANRIHLNNAGASLVSNQTLDVMISYLRLEQEIGGYEAAAQEHDRIEDFYSTAAKLLKCQPDKIAFADSATRAWNTILFSMKLGEGDKIVTVSTEFGSNVVSLQALSERTGAELIVLDLDNHGKLDLQHLDDHIDERLKLVALSHAPAQNGSVINAREIGKQLEGSEAFYLLDACQSVGQFDVEVDDIGCDALVGTGRKWLRGPRGTGFIYANDRFATSLQSVSVDLANADWLASPESGSQVSFFKKAQRLQTWERSLAGQLGLANAMFEYMSANAKGAITSAIQEFREMIADAVSKNPKLVLYPGGNSESGVITFYSHEIDAAELKKYYADLNINVSTLSDWDAPWDFTNKGLPTLLRVSPHYINSNEDIEKFIRATEKI